MTILIVILILVAVFVLGMIPAYMYTFYSPGPKQGNYHRGLTGPQYLEFEDRTLALVDKTAALDWENVSTKSRDGLKLTGFYHETKKGAPLMICFHGYRGHGFRDFCGTTLDLIEEGVNVLLINHRAHNGSQGHAITYGYFERMDAAEWVKYAVNRFGKDVKIDLMGVSMGAATVLMATGQNLPANVRGVFADCPYDAPGRIIRKVMRDKHMPQPIYYPLKLVARIVAGFNTDGVDAAEEVKKAKMPIMIIHGDDDRFVPDAMSLRVAQANPSIRREIFPKTGHALAYMVDTERYVKLMKDFVRKTLG